LRSSARGVCCTPPPSQGRCCGIVYQRGPHLAYILHTLYHGRIFTQVGGKWGCLERGVRPLNRNQKATARQLSLAAYLLSSDGRRRNEVSIRENLPPYAEVYAASLAQHADTDHAEDALRRQLHRDVEALAGAGISVSVEGTREGHLYSPRATSTRGMLTATLAVAATIESCSFTWQQNHRSTAPSIRPVSHCT
jgi:hypothetical protein